MQRLILVLFIATELCYYLLIAQTGIVEYFSSNIFVIAPLPIGGIIGSFLIPYLKIENKNKISILLVIQLIMSFIYPNFNFITLFILGLTVGALAPLIINEIKKADFIQLGLALCISYVTGTMMFNYDVELRDIIAIILTIITLISSRFLPNKELERDYSESFSLYAMVLWIFLDSALFESLSRDITISIWRDGYSLEIALFHIVGVVAALTLKLEKNQKELFIIILFALSYLFYFLREGFILSLIYPFVISYYNVIILQTIIKKDFKTISIYMIFIGWIASGAGLFVALENLILFVPVILLITLLKIMSNQFIPNNKEVNYV
ncbi:hypothetical protein GCM10012288_18600 [Malaciobacter pacificus]|jgi:hypothetical protein|uniref:Putative membrane protein n=1 Tax=Malaciobacter pacificus TaxID=1080223 RepID=A0A5C2H612_9BACT|nr:hypothetical protein [Malaciobacter pacificus]QEP33638.1 putative membrane protein [Malaciobacter pacificus]GGD44568.1 hypothetical protein GCM10012288_18600 [Malaciobacter pacificus]